MRSRSPYPPFNPQTPDNARRCVPHTAFILWIASLTLAMTKPHARHCEDSLESEAIHQRFSKQPKRIREFIESKQLEKAEYEREAGNKAEFTSAKLEA
ncbi:hypothetical protein [Helicobacter sp. MIT 99-10781]|uniref:hypothetical protein n=1 Tax=Helicobacter sp. MIT 99-10781 TaxID=1332285 RepID=UPI0015F24FFF|nr:hypothetical protein [Helicobacter sp. MIT 99-10781]